MSPDTLDSFVLHLADFVGKLMPPEKHGGDFFDNDINYNMLSDFVYEELEKFCTRDRNYN